MHQDLHIDDKDLLNSELMEAVLSGNYDSLSPSEWMNAGYVGVDMPSSREGEWLRIAVPEPSRRKVFVEDYIHVPFGSFVIRHNSLFHSGHYGSPGNTRLHAMVFSRGAVTNATELGYLRKLMSPKYASSIAAKWGRIWNKPVVKMGCTDAAGSMRYTNKAINMLKGRGTRYHEKLMSV